MHETFTHTFKSFSPEREVAIQTEVFKQLLRTYTEGELGDGEY